MNEYKPDYIKIFNKLEQIKNETWLTESQKWWPDNLFHFTDIINAINILKEGKLYSRLSLEQQNTNHFDIASSDVINNTENIWKNYVRLYFRPRTPTLYRNEGFRTQSELQLHSQCPVPIYFVFNSKEILAQETTLFSNGNLAAEAETGNDFSFFDSLPFHKIYHDASLYGYSNGDKRNIIFHRHAEVIIPNELTLQHLKFISCRSNAEFQMFKYMLPEDILKKYSNKIRIASKALLFYANWTFIETVDLNSEELVFHFNPSTTSIGKFKAHVELVDKEINKTYSWEDDNFLANKKLRFNLDNLNNPSNYEISLYLNDHIAYKNTFTESTDSPF